MTSQISREAEKSHNRLIHEKSPYLLQHAGNPVDWYPWGEKAFEKARKEDRPVFLSIGYSSCHWCHVMAHESFEDPEVARLMNDVFVSIKVDKEERPDIDKTYMAACQMMAGNGGWPLTIIMTPEKKPFFAATYIPKRSKFGRAGMLELIPRIREIWAMQRDRALRSADQITDALIQAAKTTSGKELGESALKRAYDHLAQKFDRQNGGFGSAPKFPTPHNLLFLLRYWKRSGDRQALEMAGKTLQAMRRGGIFDHVGFGFHRYSTDAKWLVPHFEKMLYDQALIAAACVEAYQATGKEEYKRTASEILTYVLRDMKSPVGGFYSAEDADSEGEEGKFYLWTYDEIRQLLKPQEAAPVIEVFGVEEEGNFREEATGTETGKNILHLKRPLTELAADMKASERELRKRLEQVRQKLFGARERRVRPHKDDKILTDWNGLMIAALAKAAGAFDDSSYCEAAAAAADFILNTMRTADGRLLHRYRDGEAAVTANLDDYAFLAWGLLELYETTFDTKYLRAAIELTEATIADFWDEKDGGFYFTPDDAKDTLVRQKEIYDGAVPSGNSVAMPNLLRLGRIMGNSDFEEKAAAIGRAFSMKVNEYPAGYTFLLIGVDFAVGPACEVVIAGNLQGEDTKAILKALRTRFVPNKVVIFKPAGQEKPGIAEIAPFIEGQTSIEGRAAAYVCTNHACKFPTTNAGKMLELLDEGKSSE